MINKPGSNHRLPPVDPAFLEEFLPREVGLIQRRHLGHPGGDTGSGGGSQLAFFLLRLHPLEGSHFPAEEEGGLAIRKRLVEMMSRSLRFSDVVAELGRDEILGIGRDLEGDQAFQITQRILMSAGSLDLLRGAGLVVRLSYMVYPLSSQPDLDPRDWRLLVDLARCLLEREMNPESTGGCGLLPSGETAPSVSEADLVRLALGDLDSLTSAGLLRLERIHLLPGG